MKAFFENQTDSFRAFSTESFSFPPHLHPQLELLWVESGEITVTVQDRTECLSAGSLAVVFPNQIHGYTVSENNGQIAMLIIGLEYVGNYLDTLLRFYPMNPFLTAEQVHPNVGYAIRELITEWYGQKPEGSVSRAFTQLILARLLPQLELQQNKRSDNQDITWQIVNFVNEHYREPLSLDMLAHGIGISRYRLSHVFSEKIGQSFPNYLASIRLSYARTMLLETEHSVTEIGEEAGFESQRTFYRMFRQIYGMSPLEYRKKMSGR